MFEKMIWEEDVVNVAGSSVGVEGGWELVEVRQVVRNG